MNLIFPPDSGYWIPCCVINDVHTNLARTMPLFNVGLKYRCQVSGVRTNNLGIANLGI